jgi:hypothetical protein
VGEDEFTMPMTRLYRCASNRERHGDDMPPGYVGPSKELDDICTERGVAFDENFSFLRRGRLSQLREDAWREVLAVVRNSLRRIERRSCGIDMRPEDFAAFDSSA